jgi:predicted RNA polymerase sigma factor
MHLGPAAGLAIVDSLRSEGKLQDYPYLPSVRGDLLAMLERFDEARQEFQRAATLTQNARERELLVVKADASARKAGRPATATGERTSRP